MQHYQPHNTGYGHQYGDSHRQSGQPQQNLTIVMQQPTQNTPSGQKQNVRDWSSGLCGCCEDCSSCCYAYFCYPCFLCTLATSMDECYCGPHCFGGAASYAGLLTNCCLLPTASNSFLVALRTKMRAQHGIKGSVCKDICCMWCCQFCAVTQIYREVKHVGKN